MSNDIVLFEKISRLEKRILALELELESRDQKHLQELRLLQKQLESSMNKYFLN